MGAGCEPARSSGEKVGVVAHFFLFAVVEAKPS